MRSLITITMEHGGVKAFYCTQHYLDNAMLILTGNVSEAYLKEGDDPDSHHDQLGINVDRIAFFTSESVK